MLGNPVPSSISTRIEDLQHSMISVWCEGRVGVGGVVLVLWGKDLLLFWFSITLVLLKKAPAEYSRVRFHMSSSNLHCGIVHLLMSLCAVGRGEK